MKNWPDTRSRANLDGARVAEHKARMAASLEPVEPASTFGSTAFWRRMTQLSAERGHAEHPTMLVGRPEAGDQYVLRCTRCDQTVVEFSVDRSA